MNCGGILVRRRATVAARIAIVFLGWPNLSSAARECSAEAQCIIKRVEIRGNQAFRDNVLMKASGIDTGQPIRHDLLSKAAAAISSFYIDHGYLDSRVTHTLKCESSDSAVCFLVVDIDEGAQFLIRRLEFAGTGNEDISYRDALKLTGLQLDMPYSNTRLSKAIDRVNRSNRFDPITEQHVETAINHDEHHVDLRFHLTRKAK
jgi:hypothetical protein